MDDKNITVSIFRISTDSEFLDMIFECPNDYHFTFLEVEVRLLGKDGKFYSQWFDLSTVLQFGENTDKTKWSIRVPINKLGINSPGIYIASLKAELNEIETSDLNTIQEINDTMICSDVNNVYHYILDYVLNTENKCFEVSDDAIRNYLILYGHQQALQQYDLETAEMYFKLIHNHFDKCGNSYRPTDRIHNRSCNCSK